MALQSYNYKAREQVEWEEKRSLPVITGEDKYVSTGHSITQNYDGPLADMRHIMTGLTGSMTNRVEATLTRQADGQSGKLRIVRTDYVLREETEEEEGSGGSPSEPVPGEDESMPSYSTSTNAVLEPLLTHPLFADKLKNNEPALQALKMLIDGATLSDLVRDPEDPKGKRILGTVGQLTKGFTLAKEYILKGVTEFYSPHTVLTARFKVTSYESKELSQVGTIVTPKGGYPTPKGRNWLCIGQGIEITGKDYWASETYELSGPGGWDTTLYADESS